MNKNSWRDSKLLLARVIGAFLSNPPNLDLYQQVGISGDTKAICNDVRKALGAVNKE